MGHLVRLRQVCDLYVTGAPCPPWSAAGKKGGLEDSRGHILFRCLKYICLKRPRTLVLENVKGIRSQQFVHVLHFIESVLRNCKYNIQHTVLDTKDHGIPQSRPRWYLVGIQQLCDNTTFQWPDKIKGPSLSHFLDAETHMADCGLTQLTARARKIVDRAMRKTFQNMQATEACLDVNASAAFANSLTDCSLCLTRSRAGSKGYWLIRRQRMMSIHEIASLQGWPGDYVDVMKQHASNRHIGLSLGDGMSVNILMRLLPRVLHAGGLLRREPEDLWKHAPMLAQQPGLKLPDAVCICRG